MTGTPQLSVVVPVHGEAARSSHPQTSLARRSCVHLGPACFCSSSRPGRAPGRRAPDGAAGHPRRHGDGAQGQGLTGQVVILNGVPRSGKTSIAKAMQENPEALNKAMPELIKNVSAGNAAGVEKQNRYRSVDRNRFRYGKCGRYCAPWRIRTVGGAAFRCGGLRCQQSGQDNKYRRP